jgi:hypothetical protein
MVLLSNIEKCSKGIIGYTPKKEKLLFKGSIEKSIDISAEEELANNPDIYVQIIENYERDGIKFIRYMQYTPLNIS